MSKKAHETALPKLRFPEFQGKEAWIEKKLGELFFERQERGSLDLPLLSLTDKEGIIPQEDSNRKNTSNSDKSKYLRVHLGDIAYNTMRMWEGRSALVTMEGVISPAYTVCKPKTGVNSLFFFYYFKTKPLIQQFHRYSQGLVKDTLNLKFQAFSKIQTLVPVEVEEQQKVAAALSSLDALITAQTAKLTALQAHKRGLMQDLFPAEGETVPKRRFPEFQEAGEWIEKKLGDVCKMQAGKFVSASNIYAEAHENLFPCYGGNGLRGYTKTFTHRGKYSLVGRQGALCGNVVLATGKFHATEHAVVTTPNSKIDTDWLYYLLVILDLNQYATGAAQPGLSVQNLEKVEIKIPQAEAEQQKIADCLTSLDNLITTQSQEIDALKLHKKGLMQALFPTSSAPEA